MRVVEMIAAPCFTCNSPWDDGPKAGCPECGGSGECLYPDEETPEEAEAAEVALWQAAMELLEPGTTHKDARGG